MNVTVFPLDVPAAPAQDALALVRRSLERRERPVGIGRRRDDEDLHPVASRVRCTGRSCPAPAALSGVARASGTGDGVQRTGDRIERVAREDRLGARGVRASPRPAPAGGGPSAAARPACVSSAPRLAPTMCMIPCASRNAAIATSTTITAQKWRLRSWSMGMRWRERDVGAGSARERCEQGELAPRSNLRGTCHAPKRETGRTFSSGAGRSIRQVVGGRPAWTAEATNCQRGREARCLTR